MHTHEDEDKSDAEKMANLALESIGSKKGTVRCLILLACMRKYRMNGMDALMILLRFVMVLVLFLLEFEYL